METAPTIQWGYLIYLTVLRLCQYFGAHEECGFCDINHNWRQHKKEGRPYTGVKPVEDVLEALTIIDRYDDARASKAYTLTGGSVTSTVDGLAEADFYGATRRRSRSASRSAGSARSSRRRCRARDVQRYKDYGITIYHPNYEVWDKRLFSLISPGKERYVGREEWHRRIFDAAEVFGARYVIPNFVAGVEMAKPFGFETVDEAIASTTEGLDYFMSRGITPRFTTWCPEPTTPLGRDNPDGAPLEYHIRLLEAYRDTAEKHGLKPPPGYGVAGAGNAVFSGQLLHGRAPGRGGGAGMTSRIGVDEARALWEDASDEELKRLAQGVRARWHQPDRATYMVMRIINYTNVCVAQCDYCAFYVLPNQDGGYVLSREDVFAKIDELVGVRRRPRRLQRRLQPAAAARLLLRPLRVGARALRRPGRVLRADDRRVRLPRRPRGPELRRRCRAPPRRRRPLGDRRRQRDPDRGLPGPARQVEVHGRRLLRGAARDRRERDEDDRDDGDRLRRDAGGAPRAPAARRAISRTRPAASSRSSAGRTSRTERRSAAARSWRASTGGTSRSRGSSSTTSRTSARPF